MTRIDFYNSRLTHYLAEGMAMEAAKARASAVTSSHFIESELTNVEWYRDCGENGVYS